MTAGAVTSDSVYSSDGVFSMETAHYRKLCLGLRDATRIMPTGKK